MEWPTNPERQALGFAPAAVANKSEMTKVNLI
jgi:hypothetical protein